MREREAFIIAEGDLVLIVEGDHELGDVDCIIGKGRNGSDFNPYNLYSKFGLELEDFIDIAFEGEDYFLFFFLLIVLYFLPFMLSVFDVPDGFI